MLPGCAVDGLRLVLGPGPDFTESGGSWMGKPGAGPSRVSAPPPLCRDPQGQGAQLGWDWGRGACLPQRPRPRDRGLGAVGLPSAGAPCPNPAADAASETQPGSPGRPLWVVPGGLGPARPLAWTTKGHRRGFAGGLLRSRRLGQPACVCLWLACGSRGHVGPMLGPSGGAGRARLSLEGRTRMGEGHAARRGQSCATGSRPGARGDLGAQGLRQE